MFTSQPAISLFCFFYSNTFFAIGAAPAYLVTYKFKDKTGMVGKTLKGITDRE